MPLFEPRTLSALPTDDDDTSLFACSPCLRLSFATKRVAEVSLLLFLHLPRPPSAFFFEDRRSLSPGAVYKKVWHLPTFPDIPLGPCKAAPRLCRVAENSSPFRAWRWCNLHLYRAYSDVRAVVAHPSEVSSYVLWIASEIARRNGRLRTDYYSAGKCSHHALSMQAPLAERIMILRRKKGECGTTFFAHRRTTLLAPQTNAIFKLLAGVQGRLLWNGWVAKVCFGW